MPVYVFSITIENQFKMKWCCRNWYLLCKCKDLFVSCWHVNSFCLAIGRFYMPIQKWSWCRCPALYCAKPYFGVRKNHISSNIWDTVTKVTPLYWVHQAPLYEPIITLLVPFSMELAYLSMLFIAEMACTVAKPCKQCEIMLINWCLVYWTQ